MEEDEEEKRTTPEPEAKLSMFAVREEDEPDDGIKPWFWPASRDVTKKQTTQEHPTDNKVNAKDGSSALQPSLTNGSVGDRDELTLNKKEVS